MAFRVLLSSLRVGYNHFAFLLFTRRFIFSISFSLTLNSHFSSDLPSQRPLKRSPRLWEIDALRGVAIVLMVIYHGIFYLDYFFGQPVNSQTGFWYWEGRLSAVLFMVLVGVASALLYKRYQGKDYFDKQLKRGFKLILLGLVVTLVTWFIIRDMTIWFGILSFLGFGVLITTPVAHKKWLSLALAAISLALGLWISTMHWNNFIGVFLGAPPVTYRSLDYYPLFPRLGWILLGIFLGNLLYKNMQPLLHFSPKRLGRLLVWMGKKSLWIYLIHPLPLFGLMWLIFRGGWLIFSI